jgi:sortase A
MTWRRVIAVIGGSAIAAGLGIGASIAYFYYHSDTVGHALIHSVQVQMAQAQKAARAHPTTAAHCAAFSDSVTRAQGIIEAPAISMTAPVLADDGDPQLSVAVGHVTGSAWPGGAGTGVLVAHDVSYFSRINLLQPGATVKFVTPCVTYSYRVTGHQVVASGSPLYSSPNQSILVLETCYPLDALFLAPQRFLLTTQYVGSHSNVPGATPAGA